MGLRAPVYMPLRIRKPFRRGARGNTRILFWENAPTCPPHTQHHVSGQLDYPRVCFAIGSVATRRPHLAAIRSPGSSHGIGREVYETCFYLQADSLFVRRGHRFGEYRPSRIRQRNTGPISLLRVIFATISVTLRCVVMPLHNVVSRDATSRVPNVRDRRAQL